MKYTKRNDKYIFEKDGVYFSMSLDQVQEMVHLCNEILTPPQNINGPELTYSAYEKGSVITVNHCDYSGPIIVDHCDVVTGIGEGFTPKGEKKKFFLPVKMIC